MQPAPNVNFVSSCNPSPFVIMQKPLKKSIRFLSGHCRIEEQRCIALLYHIPLGIFDCDLGEQPESQAAT